MKIRLYTAQSPEVTSLLSAGYTVYPDKSLEDKSWSAAYDWMRSQLVKRSLIKDMSSSMFWAALSLEEASLNEGDILTIEKDIFEVLVLDSNGWYSPLNGTPLVFGPGINNEDGSWDKEYDRIVNLGIEQVAKTWDYIFDVVIDSTGFKPGKSMKDFYQPNEVPDYEAVFACIRSEEVVEIQRRTNHQKPLY